MPVRLIASNWNFKYYFLKVHGARLIATGYFCNVIKNLRYFELIKSQAAHAMLLKRNFD